MACQVASSSGEQFGLDIPIKRTEQTRHCTDISYLCQSTAASIAYSSKTQLRERPLSHLSWRESKMSSGRAFGGSSFGDDILRKQAIDFSALSICPSGGLFPAPPWMGLKAYLSLKCFATSPKLAILDQVAAVTVADPVGKDADTLTLKEPARRPSVPVKRVSHLKNGKPSKSNVPSTVTRQLTCLKLSSLDIDRAREKLELLGVAEPALFKYIEQATPGDITVDRVVSLVSSLMGVTRVGWNEALSMLSKSPSLLKSEPVLIQAMVEFLMELGLDQEGVSKVIASHPALLEYDLAEMRLIVDYLTSVGILKEEFPSILLERPQAFSCKLDDVKYTIECLLQARVPSKDLSRVVAKVPELFSPVTRKNLKSRMAFFKQVGLYGGSLSKGIARRPNLLNFDLGSMRQAYDYLSDFLPPSDMAKLVRRFAEVLVIDPKRKMEPMVNHLLRLGVKEESLGKVLLRRPQLLGYTVAGLEPTLKYLRELGITENLLGRVISISPQVLTLNCEEKLKPVVEYLRSLGLEREGDMERLLVRNAQLLCCSIDNNISPKISFFLNIGLTNKDVVKILVLFPSMFGQSIESSLVPKYNYLVNVMKRSSREIVDFPQYFGYSLEKRIKARFEKLSARGIYNVSLPSMLACVEEDFVSRYMIGTPPSRAPYKLRKTPRKSKYSDL